MFVKIQINGGNWQDLKDYKQTKMKKERGQNSKNYKYIHITDMKQKWQMQWVKRFFASCQGIEI